MKEETIFKAYKRWSEHKVWSDEKSTLLEFLDDIFPSDFTKKYEKWSKKKENGRVAKRSKVPGS